MCKKDKIILIVEDDEKTREETKELWNQKVKPKS